MISDEFGMTVSNNNKSFNSKDFFDHLNFYKIRDIFNNYLIDFQKYQNILYIYKSQIIFQKTKDIIDLLRNLNENQNKTQNNQLTFDNVFSENSLIQLGNRLQSLPNLESFYFEVYFKKKNFNYNIVYDFIKTILNIKTIKYLKINIKINGRDKDQVCFINQIPQDIRTSILSITHLNELELNLLTHRKYSGDRQYYLKKYFSPQGLVKSLLIGLLNIELGGDLGELEDLQSLQLLFNDNSLHSYSLIKLNQMLFKLVNLRELRIQILWNCNIEEVYWIQFMENISKLKSIKILCLEIQKNKNIGKNAIKALQESIKKMNLENVSLRIQDQLILVEQPNLSTFHFQFSSQKQNNLEVLERSLQSMKNLKTLNLTLLFKEQQLYFIPKQFALCIQNQIQLENLVLQLYKIEDDTLRAICKLKNLRTLHLYYKRSLSMNINLFKIHYLQFKRLVDFKLAQF